MGVEPTRPGRAATPTDLKSARATGPHALPSGDYPNWVVCICGECEPPPIVESNAGSGSSETLRLVGNATKPLDVTIRLSREPKRVLLNAFHDVLWRD